MNENEKDYQDEIARLEDEVIDLEGDLRTLEDEKEELNDQKTELISTLESIKDIIIDALRLL